MANESKITGVSLAGVPESDPRVQLATERTLLAWMRTGLALIAFGFVVARFAFVLQILGAKSSYTLNMEATIIGVVLVILGIVVNIVAPLHYRRYFRRINQGDVQVFTAWSLTVFVAWALAAIGIALAIYLFMVDIANWPVGNPQ